MLIRHLPREGADAFVRILVVFGLMAAVFNLVGLPPIWTTGALIFFVLYLLLGCALDLVVWGVCGLCGIPTPREREQIAAREEVRLADAQREQQQQAHGELPKVRDLLPTVLLVTRGQTAIGDAWVMYQRIDGRWHVVLPLIPVKPGAPGGPRAVGVGPTAGAGIGAAPRTIFPFWRFLARFNDPTPHIEVDDDQDDDEDDDGPLVGARIR